jgi:hypothetical protein
MCNRNELQSMREDNQSHQTTTYCHKLTPTKAHQKNTPISLREKIIASICTKERRRRWREMAKEARGDGFVLTQDWTCAQETGGKKLERGKPWWW